MGPKCEEALKKLAQKMADKRDERYANVISFMRIKLRFALLRSTLIAVRGERGKIIRREPQLSSVNLDLETHSQYPYEG